MNVLPSAPPQLYPVQELTQLNAEDFRLKKINDLLKELSDEVEHYRQVAKKYKRSHSMVHASAVGLGSLSVGLSSGALATALTGFGIVASPALAGVATLCGLGSVGFAAASKRLERKSDQAREDLHTCPGEEELRQRTGLQGSCWQTDQWCWVFASSHAKLRSITKSKLQYARALKLFIQKAATQTQGPDIEKLKEELRKEVKKEFQKKVNQLTAVSKSDLNEWAPGLSCTSHEQNTPIE